MVVIRLARRGSKSRPFYDVVVTDSRNARDGQPIERVGYYNPIATSTQVAIHLDIARVNDWKSKGAKFSLTASNLVKKFLKMNPQAVANA